MCKEKRLATVPLLIRSNYSRVLKKRVKTFDPLLALARHSHSFDHFYIPLPTTQTRERTLNIVMHIWMKHSETTCPEVSIFIRLFAFLFSLVMVKRKRKDKRENGQEKAGRKSGCRGKVSVDAGEDNAAWMSGRASEPIPSRACFPGSWTRPKEKEKRHRGRNGDESTRKNSLPGTGRMSRRCQRRRWRRRRRRHYTTGGKHTG